MGTVVNKNLCYGWAVYAGFYAHNAITMGKGPRTAPYAKIDEENAAIAASV
jgi:hypothetical protein